MDRFFRHKFSSKKSVILTTNFYTSVTIGKNSFQDIIILCNHISIKLPVRTQYAFSNQFVTIVISRGYAKFDLCFYPFAIYGEV